MRAAPWLPAARSFPPCLGSALAALLLVAGTISQAQAVQTQPSTLKVQQLLGRAEVQEGQVWRPLTGSAPVISGLRTGMGRAWLSSTGGGRAGTLLVGPSSRLRVYRGEADLQAGQFLLGGPLSVHVLGGHLVLDRGTQARVDLAGPGTPVRVALLEGTARIALGGQVVRLNAGQQINLGSGQVTPFTGADPWYAAQFVGVGGVTVQATRGPVYVSTDGERRIAGAGDALEPGERLLTGSGAWAEVGFAGGGDLRLQAGSELGVLGVQRTARGREVTLQLTRGSAWNVARGGQGSAPGAPLLEGAVRGGVFQVGVKGLTRTFGASSAAALAAAPAATTRLNQPLDAEREQPLSLQLDPLPRALRNLTLGATSLPDARLSARVGRRVLPLTPLSGQPGRFRLIPSGEALPEGQTSVQVRAEWRGQVRTRTAEVVLDRTPPTLSGLRAERTGRVLLLTGTLRDAGTALSNTGRLGVTVRLGAESFTRSVALTGGETANLRLSLPAPDAGTPVRVTVRDEAGNESDALLP